MKSIVERDPAERCFLCGTWGQLEKHHIFGGPNRKWSEKYGMTVHLCPVCHRDNRRGVHGDAEKMLALHQTGQREFEQKYSHKKFMQIFGKTIWIQRKLNGSYDRSQEHRKQAGRRTGGADWTLSEWEPDLYILSGKCRKYLVRDPVPDGRKEVSEYESIFGEGKKRR